MGLTDDVLERLHDPTRFDGPWFDYWTCWWCGHAEQIARPPEPE